MSRPVHPSHVDENAYFGKVEDEVSEEGVLEDAYGVLENDKDEASNKENGEGAAMPASPTTQIRKRVALIVCAQSNLERLGNFDLC